MPGRSLLIPDSSPHPPFSGHPTAQFPDDSEIKGENPEGEGMELLELLEPGRSQVGGEV
jgi:hypothetical protein